MTKTLLHIDASALSDASVSRRLSAGIVERLGAETVIRRDLAAGLPVIDEAWVGANFTPADKRSDAQKALLAQSDALVDELTAADTIVIGTPMYNFAAPTTLKSWIDLVARVGRVFRYSEAGPEGLLKGKRAIVAIATGGTPVGSGYDFLSGYLRHMLGFFGITDVTFVTADQAATPADVRVASARDQIERLAA